MSITPIETPLDGERVIGLSPEHANAAASDWLRRPNLFAGRALTAPTLEQRQRWQAGRIAIRAQAFTRGVVRGLEVRVSAGPGTDGLAAVRLQIAPGRALTWSGEDVVLPAPVDVRLGDVPVVAEPAVFAEAAGEAPPAPPAPGGLGVLRPRAIGTALSALIGIRSDILPTVGVLVLQPIVADRSDFDPTDPCERCHCAESADAAPDSVEDWRSADGVRLLWYAWPDEWASLPPDTPRRRNALAHIVFDAEAALGDGDPLPWEPWGAPIAIVGMTPAWQPAYVDRATVVRQGGRARHARLRGAAQWLAADSRLPGLWQARIEQLAEQIAELGNPLPEAATLAQAFTRLPPAGLLPINVMNLEALPLNAASEVLRSTFFPAGFELDAVPVPLPQLDVAIRDAAPLAAIDFSAAERVRVLVPVTQASFEPRLLFEEIVAPEFQQTVDRFVLTRARAVGARHGLRHTVATLARAANGALAVPPLTVVRPGTTVPVPALGDDPLALEPETLAPWGPPPAGGGHRAPLASGTHQHDFAGATATITAGDSELLFAWIYLDPADPPQTLMLQWHARENWDHRAYWGPNLIATGDSGTSSPRAQIDPTLPPAGRWLRLTIAPGAVGVASVPLDGMAFTLFGGRAAFGPTGVARASGDSVWFANQLPAGAVTGGDHPWEFLTDADLWAPFESPLGVTPPTSPPAGSGPAVTSVVTAVEALRADAALAPLSVREREQLDARGVQGFVTYLKSRADRADDLVDYGFIKVQTDVYRVRQLVLGTTAATRLAVSPALATIAQAETAVASQEQIASFYDNLISATPPVAPSPRRIMGGGGGSVPAAFEIGGIPGARVGRSAEQTARTFAAGATLAGGSSLISPGGATSIQVEANIGLQPPLAPSLDATLAIQDAGMVRAKTQDAGVIGIKATVAAPADVINAPPIVGKANIRTTAIAQRLQDPKAIEAKDYTAATRHDAVAALMRLADELRAEDGGVTPALFEGIDVYGVRDDPFLGADNASRRVPLGMFITDRARLTQLLTTPVRTRPVPGAQETAPDEGAYFSDSADLSDNTVALMRQLEGRIKLYRDAIAAAERTLVTLREGIARGNARLAAVADTLAEARHDVSVAKALLAEESDRIAAINQRRATVLAQEVRFLAFVRPRQTDALASAPRRQVDPGLIEAPAPICLGDHGDVPDDLTDILRAVREAPAAWFADVPRLFEPLDRTDLLLKALRSAQVRLPLIGTPGTAAATSRATGAIASMKSRQLQAVTHARSAALQLDLSRMQSLTWQGLRDQAAQVVSLGDLIDGEHGRGEVARRAAQTFDDVGRIAACLHAAFSSVLPSIRLDWAETLSQFDEAPNLRQLGALARWGEIPYVERHRLQALADWLFSRINAAEPRGESLMNDVVRICLLLASHAPVGRIIAGRLPRPLTIRPGVRLPLTAFDASKVRVGMEALVYRGANIVARALVEDIGAEIATRVVHTAQPHVDLDVDVRVQFGAAATLSRTAASRAMVITR